MGAAGHRQRWPKLRRVRRVWGRVAGVRHLFPLSPLGLAVLALALWLSFGYGQKQVDRVVYAAGLVTVGVVALSTLLVGLGTLRVFIAARRAGGRAELLLQTGAEADTGFTIPGLALWPGLQLKLFWERPAEVEVRLQRGLGHSRERVKPLRRGEHRAVLRRIQVSDIFGFASLAPRVSRPTPIRVEPPAARLTAHVLSRLLSGDQLSYPSPLAQGELLEMRRYAHGDPLRHVLWKVFARSRKLMVRTPEQAIDPRPSAAAYLVAGPDDEPAASAARAFVEGGLLGEDFVFSADGAPAPADTPAAALDLIVGSASAAEDQGGGLARFVEQLERDRLQAFVLFVPQSPGPWLERVAEVAPRLSGGRVITAIDARPAGAPRARWQRWLFARPGDDWAGRRQLHAVVQSLSRSGLEVFVLHRPSGELLGEAQLAALAGVTP